MPGGDNSACLADACLLYDFATGIQRSEVADILGRGSDHLLHNGTAASAGISIEPMALAHPQLTDHMQPNLNKNLINLSDSAVATILNSKRKSTQLRYQNKIFLWKGYCRANSLCYTDPGISNVINYLSGLKDRGLSFSTIGISRSAISSVCNPVDGVLVGSHPLVSKFMKGLGFERPKLPKYASTWDIDQVLNLLASALYADNDSIPFHNLQVKTMLLILITTACRISVILRLSILPDRVVDRGDHFVLFPMGLDKNATAQKHAQELYLFDSESSLSPYLALKALLSRRTPTQNSFIFQSSIIGKTLNTNMLRNWASKVMTKAGVPDNFKTHSIRGAVASKASTLLDTSDIMIAANWRNENTLRRFYLRNSGHNTVQQKSRLFQNCVLKV